MHVWWHPAVADAAEISATLEIVEPPTVEHLHFWALQATFVDARNQPVGTAHLGLQWYTAHPGSTAVNWGGYRPHGQGELGQVTPPRLPSATGNPNTRDYRWRPHTPYRLTITADGTGAVTDLATNRTTVVRRLDVPGATRLTDPVVWSEVFARCDDPPSAVRWFDLSPARRSSTRPTSPTRTGAAPTPTSTTIPDEARSRSARIANGRRRRAA